MRVFHGLRFKSHHQKIQQFLWTHEALVQGEEEGDEFRIMDEEEMGEDEWEWDIFPALSCCFCG